MSLRIPETLSHRQGPRAGSVVTREVAPGQTQVPLEVSSGWLLKIQLRLERFFSLALAAADGVR